MRKHSWHVYMNARYWLRCEARDPWNFCFKNLHLATFDRKWEIWYLRTESDKGQALTVLNTRNQATSLHANNDGIPYRTRQYCVEWYKNDIHAISSSQSGTGQACLSDCTGRLPNALKWKDVGVFIQTGWTYSVACLHLQDFLWDLLRDGEQELNTKSSCTSMNMVSADADTGLPAGCLVLGTWID